ncbi:NEDD4-binding protein 2-like 1 isoform 1-T1 [Discoglossus pictus]
MAERLINSFGNLSLEGPGRNRQRPPHRKQNNGPQQPATRPPQPGRQQHPAPRPSRFSKHLYLLRGLPGSGKSSLARKLKRDFPSALVFSTDNYFILEDGTYLYDHELLREAHKWNQKQARQAMNRGKTPIIIDNTNIQAWEMKPYVIMMGEGESELMIYSPVIKQDLLKIWCDTNPRELEFNSPDALENNYQVVFLEPDTRWKFNVPELARKNSHGVPRDKIQRMKEVYEHNVTFHTVLHSEKPTRNDSHF